MFHYLYLVFEISLCLLSFVCQIFVYIPFFAGFGWLSLFIGCILRYEASFVFCLCFFISLGKSASLFSLDTCTSYLPMYVFFIHLHFQPHFVPIPILNWGVKRVAPLHISPHHIIPSLIIFTPKCSTPFPYANCMSLVVAAYSGL